MGALTIVMMSCVRSIRNQDITCWQILKSLDFQAFQDNMQFWTYTHTTHYHIIITGLSARFVFNEKEIANLVGSALEEADLSDARGDLASSHDSIWQMANGIISASTKILKREFPAYPDYVSGHEWFVSPQEAGEAFANRIYRQVTMHAHELEIIEKHWKPWNTVAD